MSIQLIAALSLLIGPSSPPLASGVHLGQTTQSTQSEAATPSLVQGTRISLVRPKGYARSSSFSGYLSATGCSLIVAELDAGFEEMLASLSSPQALRTKGMSLTSSKPKPMGEFRGEELRIDQAVGEVEVRKLIWLVGTESKCALIMAVCPVEQFEDESEALFGAVRSAKWDPKLDLAPAAGLVYRIGDTQGMKLQASLSASVTYTPDGKDDRAGEGKPIFLCSPSHQPVSVLDANFAWRRIRQVEGYASIRPDWPVPVMVDGLPGYSCLATAQDKRDRSPSFIYLVVLSEGESYWALVGIGREQDRERYLPAFKKMAASFERQWVPLQSLGNSCQLTVPATWTIREGINGEADIQAGHPIGSNYVVVLTEAKDEFEEGYTYRDHARATRSPFEEDAVYSPEPVDIKIGALRAISSLFVSGPEGTRFFYQHVVVDGPRYLHQIVFWCPESAMDAAELDFARALQSFAEGPG